MLTDSSIKKLRPNGAQQWHVDGAVPGLQLGITPTGSKSWALRYVSPIDGKRKVYKLGTWPAMKCPAARKEAITLREQISAGGCPQTSKRRQGAAGDVTAGALLRQYVESLRAQGKASADEVARMFERDALPAIESIPAAAVTGKDILRILRPVVDRGAPAVARNLRSALAAAFTFGQKAHNSVMWSATVPDFGITSNPVDSTAPIPVRSIGERTLSAAEFSELYAEAHRIARPPMNYALRYLLLTGQRVREVLELRVTDIDPGTFDVSIPGTRRKTRHTGEHLIPTTMIAAGVLIQVETWRETVGLTESDYVFPSTRNHEPVTEGALRQAVLKWCKRTGFERFTPRDIRRGWKTLAGDLGISSEVRNLVQGHAASDVASVHYDRSQQRKAKIAALQTVAAAIDRAVVSHK